MGSYLSIITLNVNGLNAPTKRQRLAEWIQKQDPSICCLQETHLKTRDTYRLKVKGWKKIFHANRNQKKAGVAILISEKIDFKTKAVKRDKEGHYIMIKGSIQEEDIAIINIYAPNIGAPQYVREMLTSMKGEINNNTIIGVSGVLKSSTIIVLLLISPFILVSICLTYCGAPMLGAYIFIIAISSSWIDPLIIM